MIISHRHRFIFIKTMKTAGTSLEVFLSQLCGEDDIVTPFGRAEPGHRPRNFAGYFNHMGAREVIAKAGQALWDDYFTFCFERNPWDKTVSHYWFLKGRTAKPADWSFEQFLTTGDLPHNLQFYSDRGKPLVDFIGRYESLERDLASVLHRCGIDSKVELPRAKAGYRSDLRHYSSYYNEKRRDFVAEQFRAEIALHGYRFEEASNRSVDAADTALRHGRNQAT